MQKTAAFTVAVLTLGSMSLLCRSSIWSLAGGASHSVHRQSSWTFQYAQRRGTFSWAGDVTLRTRGASDSVIDRVQ